MKAKVLKNICYRGTILHAGEVHEIGDVSFYTFEKRGLVEAVKVVDEKKSAKSVDIPAELPALEVQTRK